MGKVYTGPYVTLKGKKIAKPLALITQIRDRMKKDGVPMKKWPPYPIYGNNSWMGKNFKTT